MFVLLSTTDKRFQDPMSEEKPYWMNEWNPTKNQIQRPERSFTFIREKSRSNRPKNPESLIDRNLLQNPKSTFYPNPKKNRLKICTYWWPRTCWLSISTKAWKVPTKIRDLSFCMDVWSWLLVWLPFYWSFSSLRYLSRRRCFPASNAHRPASLLFAWIFANTRSGYRTGRRPRWSGKGYHR